MSVRKRCLMIERAIYAEEELQEIPVEYQDMWDYMEAITEEEKKAMSITKEGSSSQGGGSWPSTVVRSL
ncbi:hypothetical protein D8674_028629 [Pyrus ussuriensis x Pyrus communis]|uniref:Uncharacterized protein n=1 Tax=Pyrus ussuriensis x Pyrus communis TaxID=2448454 RepID=A0A5N5I1V1_9ROSA|nr:hypothetical protein D8674_028629 [Pyrus ussuriensis x Pyrus communis]